MHVYRLSTLLVFTARSSASLIVAALVSTFCGELERFIYIRNTDQNLINVFRCKGFTLKVLHSRNVHVLSTT